MNYSMYSTSLGVHEDVDFLASTIPLYYNNNLNTPPPVSPKFHAISFTIVAIASLFAITYLVTYFNALTAFRNKNHALVPSIAPYWIPGLAHSVPFLWDTAGIVTWAS